MRAAHACRAGLAVGVAAGAAAFAMLAALARTAHRRTQPTAAGPPPAGCPNCQAYNKLVADLAAECPGPAADQLRRVLSMWEEHVRAVHMPTGMERQ